MNSITPSYKKIFLTLNFTFIVLLVFTFNNCQSVEDEVSSLALRGGPNSKGNLISVTELGNVLGWAMDPDSLSDRLVVQFFVDGPEGTGQLVLTVTASETQFGPYEGHYFSFVLPTPYRDRLSHLLYAYIATPQGLIPLSGSPTRYQAFGPTPEGRNYYNQNLVADLQVCTACHSTSYEEHYGSLLQPNKFNGGSSTNNRLINRASGQGHGGGSHCSSKNSGLCSKIQTWWTIEFGN